MGLNNAFSPAHDDTYPALRFQRHFKLDGLGIGRYWIMPDGVSMADMQDGLRANKVLEIWQGYDPEIRLTAALAQQQPDMAARFARASAAADNFIRLNPDLETVRFDRTYWHALRGFVHGVVSGFNVDDLQGWIDKTLNYRMADELKNYIRAEYQAPQGQSVYPVSLRDHFNALADAGYPYLDRDIHGLGWVPSPATIRRIYDGFESRRDFTNGGLKPVS